MWRSLASGVVLAVLLSAAAGSANLVARAAPQTNLTLTVNTAADAPDASPLDSVCETAPHNGQCSLRAAIMTANHWHQGSVTIMLPGLPSGSSYLLTIPPAGPDDDSTGNLNLYASAGRPMLTLVGSGPLSTVIDASGLVPADGALTVAPGVTATISFVGLQGGQAGRGAGLDNNGSLTLDDSYVTGNKAVVASGYLGDGGGVYNNGTMLIARALIENNTATHSGAGIFNNSHLTLSSSNLNNNNSSGGPAGGIWNADDLTLDGDEIGYNSALDGAGIFNEFGALTMTVSDLDNNTASQDGGGLYNNCGRAVVVNSTVSGNFAYGFGAGLANEFGGPTCPTGRLQLYNATIAFNAAALGGSGHGGGLYTQVGIVANLQNTILSNNQLGLGSFNPSDCNGAPISLGYNLVSSLADTCQVTGTTTGNIIDLFARLRPLAFNGGLTVNHALNPNSPAVDAGNPSGCTDNLGALKTDQRGAPRPANYKGTTRCDMGAYELQRSLDLPLLRR